MTSSDAVVSVRGLIDHIPRSRPEPSPRRQQPLGKCAIYLRWDWYIVGRFRDEPMMDALVKDVP
jgi:hypothetical protein